MGARRGTDRRTGGTTQRGGSDPVGVFRFTAPVRRHPGDAGWRFVTLPRDVGEDVADLTAGLRRGFGSVRVAVTVGTTSWRTSVFPDAASGSFVLPVKRAVRDAEGLRDDDEVTVRLELVDL